MKHKTFISMLLLSAIITLINLLKTHHQYVIQYDDNPDVNSLLEVEVLHHPSWNKSSSMNGNEPPGNWFYHRAIAGLGHRLARVSSLFHLAVIVSSSTDSLRISYIHNDWKNCEPYPMEESSTYKSYIWEMLLGSDNITVPTDLNYKNLDWCVQLSSSSSSSSGTGTGNNITATKQQHQQKFTFNNEIPGYYPLHMLKKARFRVLENIMKTKVQTDAYFYSYIQTKFRQRHNLEFSNFFARFNFNDFFVIGLHLRFGSDRDSYFHQKERNNALNQQIYCRNIVQLIHQIIQEKQDNKPFMLFLATDNQDIVNLLNQTIHSEHVPITLATNYQPNQYKWDGHVFYNENNQASYNYESCMASWKNSMMDMVLLSMSDLLIAGMHSTFVQTMPISLIFNRGQSTSNSTTTTSNNMISSYDPNHILPFPVYCEVSRAGNAATCHSSYRSVSHQDYTIENQTTFFYGVKNDTDSWSIKSRHKHENLVPVNCRL